MKKYTNIDTLIVLLSLIFSTLTSDSQPPVTPLILGTIQFPHTITSVPTPRIYCMGKTIPCEVHEGSKKVTFDLPKNRHLNSLYLLVTESIDYKIKKNTRLNQQTIDYIYVPEKNSYKIYELTLVSHKEQENDREERTVYRWEVTEKLLASDERRIPDETIIILYPPEYIDSITGGSSLELPTIVVKSDVVDLAGSADQLYEESIKLQLASLNSDTIHAPLKHAIKQIGHRTLIAPTM